MAVLNFLQSLTSYSWLLSCMETKRDVYSLLSSTIDDEFVLLLSGQVKDKIKMRISKQSTPL